MFLLNFSKSLNKPALACQKLCLLVTILTPHDGITRFDGIPRKKKCLLNKFLGLCTPPNTSFYALFMLQNRPKSQKRLLDVYIISHGRRIFAHMQVGGLLGSRGWGESCKTGLKSVHGKNAAVYSSIVGLTDL